MLAGIILLAWIIVQLWPSSGSEDTSASNHSTKADTKPTPTDEADAEPTSGPKNAVQTALEYGDAACDPEDVVVSPSVPDGQHAGEDVTVQFTVSTTSGKACEFDPERSELLAVISSNKDAVWDSTVCDTALLDKNVKIPARFATVVDGTWSGRGSGSDCGKNNDYAGTGKYELKIATLGGEPAKTSFALTAKKDKSDADSKKDSKKGEQKNDKSDNKDNSKDDESKKDESEKDDSEKKPQKSD